MSGQKKAAHRVQPEGLARAAAARRAKAAEARARDREALAAELATPATAIDPLERIALALEAIARELRTTSRIVAIRCPRGG